MLIKSLLGRTELKVFYTLSATNVLAIVVIALVRYLSGGASYFFESLYITLWQFGAPLSLVSDAITDFIQPINVLFLTPLIGVTWWPSIITFVWKNRSQHLVVRTGLVVVIAAIQIYSAWLISNHIQPPLGNDYAKRYARDYFLGRTPTWYQPASDDKSIEFK